MNGQECIRRAAKLLDRAAEADDVSDIQARTSRHLGAVAEELARSVEVAREEDLRTDGGVQRRDGPDITLDSPDDLDEDDLDVPVAAIDRLLYAASRNARNRALHVTDECRQLKGSTRQTTDCPVTHPPRGTLCDDCGGESNTLDELQRAVALAGGDDGDD
jgi:hypothetical protein